MKRRSKACKIQLPASDKEATVDMLAKNVPLTLPFLDKFLLQGVPDTWMTPRLFTLENLAPNTPPLGGIMSLCDTQEWLRPDRSMPRS